MTFLDIEYLRNDTRSSHSYYRTSIGSHMRCIERWHVQWPWRTTCLGGSGDWDTVRTDRDGLSEELSSIPRVGR